MPKPTAAWGIDIGQCALKALRLELVDGVATATAFDYIEHPKILSQPDADPELLTREALEKFLSRNQLDNDLVAIGVPGQSGLARFVKLPPVEPSKVKEIVKFEAKQQIPFPLDEVVWDYQTISGGEVVNNFAMETEIGLFAMKKEVIAKHIGQFSSVAIETHVVQMAPLALCNYATYELLGKGGPNPVEAPADDVPRGKKRCVVVLDVGTDASNLIITDAGKIIWQRPLPLGGNHFTRALTKEMKLTFAKAEHLKRNAAKSPDLASILKALRPVLTDFVGEVQRSLGYFTNTHRDAHIAYLVGLGSAFRLPGLQKYMTEKLSLDVKRPNSVDRLNGDAVKSDPVFIDNLLSFPVAYGLALQGLNELGERKDYGRINTNLLPPQIKVDRMIRAKKPWMAAAAAAVLLGTGTLAVGYGAQFAAVNDKKLEDSIKAATDAASSAKGQAAQKVAGEAENAKTFTDVKAIVKGNDNRLDMLRLNEVMLAVLPRPGDDGNLKDDRAFYHQSTDGIAATRMHNERIKKGVTLDQAADDDKAEFLATVQIESVMMQYSDNLKGFLDMADKSAKLAGRDIAETMPDTEREMSSATPPRPIPKMDAGGGWVVQVAGYTMHEKGSKFLNDTLVRNLMQSARFADETNPRIPGTNGTKVDLLLPGVKDPAKGKISHVFLLMSKQVENPQPKVFAILNQNYIDKLIPPLAGDPNAGAAPTAPVDPTAMATSGGSGGTGWTPLGGGIIATPNLAPPVDVTATDAKPAKKKYRLEFILCFLVRDSVTAPAAPGAPGAPGALPAVAPKPGG
jgi:type IV pilus assembly protein PilM